jgi:hypothetical protein
MHERHRGITCQAITCQTPLARNPQTPDQHKHPHEGDYVPVSRNWHVIPFAPCTNVRGEQQP